MQTQPTPISQIISPNATPGAANRAQPSGGGDGDFQRTLNRQMEQRQASRNIAQAQAPATRPAPAPAPATPAPAAQAPASDAKSAEPAVAQDKPATSTAEASAPAARDKAPAEDSAPAAAPPADPAAEMLALVGSIQLAMQPAAASGKTAQELALRGGVKADGKSAAASALLAAGQGGKAAAQADDAGFAASLGQAQGKTPATPQAGGKVEAGKLAIDAQLAATAKAGAAIAEPIIKETPADLSRLAAQLQPGALQQAAAAAAVPADKLAGRVGTPAWDQQLGQKVVWMAAGGDQTATLTLNPPDLGPLQVVLTVTNDQADAAFMSAQPEVRQALEAALPRLRDMMSEAGIAFGNATVSDGKAQQDSGQRDGAGNGRGGNQGGGVTGGEIAITQSGGARGRPTLGEVDTFA